MEPIEWMGGGKTLSAAYAVEPARTKLHSQMDNGAYSRSIKIDGHEPIEINPQDDGPWPARWRHRANDRGSVCAVSYHRPCDEA